MFANKRKSAAAAEGWATWTASESAATWGRRTPCMSYTTNSSFQHQTPLTNVNHETRTRESHAEVHSGTDHSPFSIRHEPNVSALATFGHVKFNLSWWSQVCVAAIILHGIILHLPHTKQSKANFLRGNNSSGVFLFYRSFAFPWCRFDLEVQVCHLAPHDFCFFFHPPTGFPQWISLLEETHKTCPNTQPSIQRCLKMTRKDKSTCQGGSGIVSSKLSDMLPENPKMFQLVCVA